MSLDPFRVHPIDAHEGRPRITFSGREALHLLLGVAILSPCFAIVLRDQENGLVGWPEFSLARLVPDPFLLLAAFVAVATGFVLHELAHKLVAQRYGHWAEFRAQVATLLFSYVLAAGTGFLFAAPGAVLIQGDVTRRQRGLISLVGPGVNFVIALAAWPFTWVTNTLDPVPRLLGVVANVNALLCVFNLIPLGPLDGRKVLRWSVPAYLAAACLAVALFVSVRFLGHGWLTGG